MSLVEISNGIFRVGVASHVGGCLTHAQWRHPSGDEIDLLRRGPGTLSAKPSDLASFPMVPFANRIDRGRIPFPDGSFATLPINRPSQNTAIHGFGREAPWVIEAQSATHVRLSHTFASADVPYTYQAEQSFSVGPTSIECLISVTNTATAALPFGIGFHPWFVRTSGARLSINGRWAFPPDDREMPLDPVPFSDVTGGGGSFLVAARTPFNTPVADWDGIAEVYWPENATGLRIEAGGALRLVHIFSPQAPDVFCIEPVSHIPDVVNRRYLAKYGDMAWLAPRESLTGSMRLTPTPTSAPAHA